ncbi:hypothetical protein IJ384_01545 [bacterium]|nr:hypothetical protein [bacterium]
MRINNIQQNTNFKGYKNVISHTGISEKFPDSYHSYMVMELNNEGEKDLDTWHLIQKKLRPNKELSNHIYFTHTSILGHTMTGVDEFNISLNENSKPKNEAVLIKANQLLASLTRRLSLNSEPISDGGLYKTLIKLVEQLATMTGSKTLAEKMAYQVTSQPVKHRVTAELINKGIANDMMKYFKL